MISKFDSCHSLRAKELYTQATVAFEYAQLLSQSREKEKTSDACEFALSKIDSLLGIKDNNRELIGEAHYFRGFLLLMMGRSDEASIELSKAIEHNPRLSDAHLYRGILFAESGCTSEALAAFEIVIAIDRKDAAAHGNRSQMLLEQKQYNRALEAADSAIKLAPERPEPYRFRSLIYMELGYYKSALSDAVIALNFSEEGSNLRLDVQQLVSRIRLMMKPKLNQAANVQPNIARKRESVEKNSDNLLFFGEQRGSLKRGKLEDSSNSLNP